MSEWTDLPTAVRDTSDMAVLTTKVVAQFTVFDIAELPDVLRDAAAAFENGATALTVRNEAGFDIGRIQVVVPDA